MAVHNDVIVHVLNQEGTDYTIVVVHKNNQYVYYFMGTEQAKHTVAKLMIHRPNLLDRMYAPLWCSYDGEYVKTEEAKKKLMSGD